MNFRRFVEDDDSQWGMLDVLYIMLLGFIVLFFIAVQHMNPVRKMTNEDPKAEYQIIMSWQPDHKSDVDLWVQDPTGVRVSFRDKEINLMHLDRDDLGVSSDTMRLDSGKILKVDINREVVSIRGKVPGWWIVNVHLYAHREAKRPAQVHVEVVRVNPYAVIDVHDVTLSERGQEVTIIRFRLDNSGAMTDKNRLSKKLFTGELGGGGGDAW